MNERAARRRASARSAVAAALAVLAVHCAWGQQATLPAAALVQQSDDAAGWVGQQRTDAAAAIAHGASDAAGAVAGQAADAAASIKQLAADASADTVPRVAGPGAPGAPLAPNPEFANFPSYAGTLGARRIVLRLGGKTDDPTGVHGEYQFADTGEVVLVAGDREGDVLEAEDSADGSTISGNWVGRFAPDGSLLGDRMNPDDSDPQPFLLHPLAGPSSR
jgi:hypothetical protein